jgi:formate dehydrogenase major subunit
MDPRRTIPPSGADQWLGLNVGTDIALSNAMAREIIHSGSRTVHPAASTGFEDIGRPVEPFTLEVGERETGVPAEVIREAAHTYARPTGRRSAGRSASPSTTRRSTTSSR